MDPNYHHHRLTTASLVAEMTRAPSELPKQPFYAASYSNNGSYNNSTGSTIFDPSSLVFPVDDMSSSSSSSISNNNLIQYNMYANGLGQQSQVSQSTNWSASKISNILLVIILVSLILISIIGNCLVCVAIFTERKLRKLGNAFIVSLAIADLFVSCLVMTFALCNELLEYWPFGDWFCDVWISFDIMCCTASILNLCAISLDRFILIKDCLFYNRWMTRRVALSSLLLIWFISALVSFVPINLGWHKPDHNFVIRTGSGSNPTSSLNYHNNRGADFAIEDANNIVLSSQAASRLARATTKLQHYDQARYGHRERRSLAADLGPQVGFAGSVGGKSGAADPNGAPTKYFSAQHKANQPATDSYNHKSKAKRQTFDNKHNKSSLAKRQRQLQVDDDDDYNKQHHEKRHKISHKLESESRRVGLSNLRHYRAHEAMKIHHQQTAQEAKKLNFSAENDDWRAWRRRKRHRASGPRDMQTSSSSSELLALSSSSSFHKSVSNLPQPLYDFPNVYQPAGSGIASSLRQKKKQVDRLDNDDDNDNDGRNKIARLEAANSSASNKTQKQIMSQTGSGSARYNLASLMNVNFEPRQALEQVKMLHKQASSSKIINNPIRNFIMPEIGDNNLEQLASVMGATNKSSGKRRLVRRNNININSNSNSNEQEASIGSQERLRFKRTGDDFAKGDPSKVQPGDSSQLPQCIFTLTPTYAIVSSTISFYIPCIIMIGLYTKLYVCAMKHVKTIQSINKVTAPVVSSTATNYNNNNSNPTCSSKRALGKTAFGETESNDNNKLSPGRQIGAKQHNQRAKLLSCSKVNFNDKFNWLAVGRLRKRHANDKPNEAKEAKNALGQPSQSDKTTANTQANQLAVSETSCGFVHVSEDIVAASSLLEAKQQRIEPDTVELQKQTQKQKQTQDPCQILKHQKQQQQGISAEEAELSPLLMGSSGSGLGTTLPTTHNDDERATATQVTTLASREQILARPDGLDMAPVNSNDNQPEIHLVLASETRQKQPQQLLQRDNELQSQPACPPKPNQKQQQQQQQPQHQIQFHHQQQHHSGHLATHKAAITLGIIMGTFLFCWVPFFCLNIIKAFCVDCIPGSIFRAFTWLGYANSALNPIIYGIHNSEFRHAFNRIFFKHLRFKNNSNYMDRRYSFDARNGFNAQRNQRH